MHEYIFQTPAKTPELTYDGLSAYMDTHPSHRIGATVLLDYHGGKRSREAALPPAINFWLYGVRIAKIMPDHVYFPEHGDTHMATGQWLGQIVRDNGIGGGAGRARRRKSDPLILGPRGYCGPLCISWDRDRPIEGYAYPVNHERIAKRHQREAERDAEMKARMTP